MYCGWVLFLERNPHAPWLRHLWWVSLPLLLLILVSLIGNLGGMIGNLGGMEPSGGVGSRNMTRSTTRGKQAGLLTLLMALWGCVLWYFRERPWAVIGAGVVVAIHVRGLGKLRGRSHLISVVGWLVSGFAASFLDWPYQQKFELVYVLGGLASVLQYVWLLIGRRRRRSRSSATKRPTSSFSWGAKLSSSLRSRLSIAFIAYPAS